MPVKSSGSFCVVVLLAASLCFAQKTAPGPSLAVAKNWTPVALRIFPEISEKVQFTLATSWIAGEQSKGSMHYKVTVQRQPGVGSNPTDEGTDWLLRNISRCLLFVQLYDADEFLVRSIPIHFDLVVDDSTPGKTHLVTALKANSATQLSADEYRLFVRGGGWQLAWEPCALAEVK
jgi:hypothetical protein